MPADSSVVLGVAAPCRRARADERPAEGLPTWMSGAEAAAQASAHEAATDVSAPEAAAQVSAPEAAAKVSAAAKAAAAKAAAAKTAADVAAATKAATHMPPATPATPATMERFSRRRRGESRTCDQNNHELAQHRACLHQMTSQSSG
jgi:hypothetical protein